MRSSSEPHRPRKCSPDLVERVTFHNAENGFCVLRAKARGHRDLVTVVGHAAIISAGEWITASGEWINDRAHGQQFKARFLKTSAPSSIDRIEKYLPWPWIDEAKAMPWIEKRNGLQLAEQVRGRRSVMRLMARALVITGGPGVGKTTIVNSILKILAAKGDAAIAALCPYRPRGEAPDDRSDGRRGQDDPPASERSIQRAASNATPIIPSIAICLWSTRLP